MTSREIARPRSWAQGVAGSNPVAPTTFRGSIPETWVKRLTLHSGDIGNRFGPNGFLIGSSQQVLIVEVAQIVVHEGDEPNVLADLFDTHLLPRKHLAHVDLARAVADAPARRDPPRSSHENG